ncbi:uncharacterized protein N7511_006145 [Penicillium nucicola]|uniref:uncharacterized protein n=1 Tax=Penicillium nucicola TaxID=1850975 RepID=UPI002545908E|nr:uncharacterized protein N7511_006145 [Penicillium nucicola]KAJ5757451.1 hypothetical protein N7511_006145 [Penicillium nucicola]
MPVKQLNQLCTECKEVESELSVRQKQLCRHCFKRFIMHKVHMHINTVYKFRKENNGARHQLLLPMSFGVSSSVLLHMLNVDFQRRLDNELPMGYDLHILVVEPSTITASSPCDKNYEVLRKNNSMRTINRIPFHSIFEHVPEIDEIMREYAGAHFVDDVSKSNEERLAAFRASISTATSQTDVETVLLTRLVVELAKKSGCTSVLWGDSDSRLAAKALAGVAKGRGASLTWQVSDGMSPWGVKFQYPLRDLYKAELLDYARFTPELSEIIVPDEPASDNVLTKNLSIDELMMRYVENQGAKYPGVMANVARTANKLDPSDTQNAPSCTLCGGLLGNVKGNVGVTVAGQAEDCQSSQFCYGCMRSRPGALC